MSHYESCNISNIPTTSASAKLSLDLDLETKEIIITASRKDCSISKLLPFHMSTWGLSMESNLLERITRVTSTQRWIPST